MVDGNRADAVEAGWSLSAAARARLARPSPAPLRPPPIDDHVAVAAWRHAEHRAWLEGDPSAAACGHRPDRVGGVDVLRAGPSLATHGSASAVEAPAGGGGGPGGTPLVVYAHGGGYAVGSPTTALPITERLAARCEIVSIDYRLAPEAPYPAAVEDVRAVVEAVSATTPPDRPLVLAGDSAGAGLVVAALQRLQRVWGAAEAAGDPPAHERPPFGIDGLVLLSPHLDHGPESDAARARDPRSDVDSVAAQWLRAAYCGAVDPADPGVSPVRGELGGLPPTLVQVGTADSSFDGAVRFARLARSAGVEVTLDVWPELWHAWHYHRDLPEADLALAEAAEFCSALRS
ncbi:MAG: alpha/beta hydrolase [Actinomycetota bacterium]